MVSRRLVLFLGALMIASALLAQAMVPGRKVADGALDLSLLLPTQFGKWRAIEASTVPIAVSPELQQQQNEVYDKTLARTYADDKGRLVMLTIAYGANQTKALQVHRPEVCYSALGFQIQSQRKVELPATDGTGPIPAMQLVAIQGARNEPVTYWIRVGDRVVRGNLELGLARISYGIRGIVPDGLLFRVSAITSNFEEGFSLQQSFVEDLLRDLTPEKRRFLLGRVAAGRHG